MRRTFGTVGFSRGPTAAERRWKRVEGSPHLERHVTSYGVETRCRDCKAKTHGYEVGHYRSCPHGPEVKP